MEPTAWDPEGVTVVLDSQGQLADGANTVEVDVKQYYKMLVAARCLDLKLGKVGVPMWASAAGEEAALVATAMVAASRDWIFPGIRDAAVALARGVDYATIAAQVTGGTSPSSAALPGRVSSQEHCIAATSDAIGMHLALASGQAHAQKLLKDGGITLALFGEGLTTTGVFHETVMAAVAADLPLVFVCRSQVWPDGAPAEAGVVGDSAADRAKACGTWARRVDGADALGVLAALDEAAERCRSGRGPAFVEIVVTQLTNDPPAHRDPVERLRRYLDVTGAWTQTMQDVIEADVRGNLDRAFAAATGGAR